MAILIARINLKRQATIRECIWQQVELEKNK